MRVVWFKRAILDLIEVRDFIAQDSPNAARQVVQRIHKKVLLLSEQPNIGKVGRVANTRELIVDRTAYILPYRVRDNKIEILRVLHTSRQWPKQIL